MNTDEGTDIISLFAEDRRLLTYRPSLNKLTGGVTATILLQQIIYWWDKKKRKPFYKFKEPCLDRVEYSEGDSWCEELAFSRAEFDTALKKIAVKMHRGMKLEEVLAQPSAYVVYWTDMDRLTYYMVNAPVLARAYKEAHVKRESSDTYSENPAIRKEGIQRYIKRHSRFRYSENPAIDNKEIQETTSETTTETNQVGCVATQAPKPEKPKRKTAQKEPGDPRIKIVVDRIQQAFGATYLGWFKQVSFIKKLLDAGYTEEEIVGCWVAIRVEKGMDEFLPLAWLFDRIESYRKNGNKLPQKGNSYGQDKRANNGRRSRVPDPGDGDAYARTRDFLTAQTG
jgi:hypothetical protein